MKFHELKNKQQKVMLVWLTQETSRDSMQFLSKFQNNTKDN